MPFVRTRMHGDAVRTRLQTQCGCACQAGNPEVAGISYRGDLVEVDGKSGGWTGHKVCALGHGIKNSGSQALRRQVSK